MSRPSLLNALVFVSLTLNGLAGLAYAQTIATPAPASSTVSSAPAVAASVTPQSATLGITDGNYKLGAGDKLRVNIYGEEDLSGEFLVNGSGQVQLPLVGQVKAAGLTLHEFVGEVRTVLSDGYLKDPKVSVEVENFRPFYILGEVNKPGEYPYENGLTVQGAVALAGGYTYRAEDDEVYVRHSGGTIEEKLPVNTETKIAPGDIVRVRERLF
jgi:polysaccharide export outer membrane protein